MNKIEAMPKIEMHLHIEGTLKSDLVLKKVKEMNLDFDAEYLKKLSKPFVFKNLADFLIAYYKNMEVLKSKQDFFDLAWGHIEDIKKQNVIYTEVFFDPQPHIKRGVDINDVIDGLFEAFEKAKNEFNISGKLIMCFLKDESVKSAFETLELAKTAIKENKIVAIGFDSNEVKNWAQNFLPVVQKARKLGLKITTHSAENIFEQDPKEVIEILSPDRIDHGLYIYNQLDTLKLIKKRKLHLTLCPYPNVYSNAWKNIEDFPIKWFKDKKVSFSINSDDPAYLGGKTLTENYLIVDQFNKFAKNDWKKILINSAKATFATKNEKKEMLLKIKKFFKKLKK